jgi:hypothetical protein
MKLSTRLRIATCQATVNGYDLVPVLIFHSTGAVASQCKQRDKSLGLIRRRRREDLHFFRERERDCQHYLEGLGSM